jgi:hypothetical protein
LKWNKDYQSLAAIILLNLDLSLSHIEHNVLISDYVANPEEIWTKTPTRINTDISIDKGRRTPTISVERFSLKRKRLSEVKVGYLDMFHTHINLTRISNT